jgi:hypothetical protein
MSYGPDYPALFRRLWWLTTKRSAAIGGVTPAVRRTDVGQEIWPRDKQIVVSPTFQRGRP